MQSTRSWQNIATTITVRIGVDGSCTVVDDGRGMPIDNMKSDNPQIDGRPAVEVIMTQLACWRKIR